MPSPAIATSVPTTIDSRDGLARMKTSGAKTQPSATRNRARNSITETDGLCTDRFDREPALDCRNHLGDLDLEQAHPIQLTPAQVVTLADRVARHRHIVGQQRAVARGPRRT